MRELKEVELGEVAGGGGQNYEIDPPSATDVFDSETGVDFGPGFTSDLLHLMS
ncbi:MAG: hypothetical protein ACI9ON_000083 [Limisphaerales bacterium]|jgi:hypothetical protein